MYYIVEAFSLYHIFTVGQEKEHWTEVFQVMSTSILTCIAGFFLAYISFFRSTLLQSEWTFTFIRDTASFLLITGFANSINKNFVK